MESKNKNFAYIFNLKIGTSDYWISCYYITTNTVHYAAQLVLLSEQCWAVSWRRQVTEAD